MILATSTASYGDYKIASENTGTGGIWIFDDKLKRVKLCDEFHSVINCTEWVYIETSKENEKNE